jgi:proline racemase
MIRGTRSRAGTRVRENRRFIRVPPRGLVSKVGTIIVDPKKPVITCNVIDQSAGGACLEICGQAVIPRQFILLHGGTRKKCNVVWQVGRRFGVSY